MILLCPSPFNNGHRLKSGDRIVQSTSRRSTDFDYDVDWLLSSVTEEYVNVGANLAS